MEQVCSCQAGHVYEPYSAVPAASGLSSRKKQVLSTCFQHVNTAAGPAAVQAEPLRCPGAAKVLEGEQGRPGKGAGVLLLALTFSPSAALLFIAEAAHPSAS